MKLLLCDDHEVFRAGLRTALREFDPALVEACDCEQALRLVEQEGDVDLILLDLDLPGMDGFEGLRRLRAQHPEIAVVIVSASDEPEKVRAALEGGASGFIPKSSSTSVLQSAIRIVLSGSLYVPPEILPSLGPSQGDTRADDRRRRTREAGLTARQLEVLRLISRGLTNKEIASVLGIGHGTVKAHASSIFDALDVTNRTEAVLAMRELGIEDDAD